MYMGIFNRKQYGTYIVDSLPKRLLMGYTGAFTWEKIKKAIYVLAYLPLRLDRWKIGN